MELQCISESRPENGLKPSAHAHDGIRLSRGRISPEGVLHRHTLSDRLRAGIGCDVKVTGHSPHGDHRRVIVDPACSSEKNRVSPNDQPSALKTGYGRLDPRDHVRLFVVARASPYRGFPVLHNHNF